MRIKNQSGIRIAQSWNIIVDHLRDLSNTEMLGTDPFGLPASTAEQCDHGSSSASPEEIA